MRHESAGRFVSALTDAHGFHHGVGREDQEELADGIRAEAARIGARTGRLPDQEAVEELVADARTGLRLLGDLGPDARLERAVISGLEAVVIADQSRPVLYVQGGRVDVSHLPHGTREVIEGAEPWLGPLLSATGRVELLDGRAAGTGVLVDEDLVLTNRHVAQQVLQLAPPVGPRAVFDTGHELDGPPRTTYPVLGLLRQGEDGDPRYAHPLLADLNLDRLDLALLLLGPPTGDPPAPVALAGAEAVPLSAGDDVLVVGYPLNAASTTTQAFDQVFGAVAGVKRLSLGVVQHPAGEVEHDPRGWAFQHDASTLGGSSGSPVRPSRGGPGVAGLHMAGLHAVTNWAHALWRTPPTFWSRP